MHCIFRSGKISGLRTIHSTCGVLARRPRLIGDPGMRKRLGILEGEDSIREEVQDEEDMAALETDFSNVHMSYKEHKRALFKKRDTIGKKITIKKFFSGPKPPNMLTWAERLQIKKLNEKDPEEWNLDVLADSFPASRETISKIISGNWQPGNLAKLKRRDETVRENWRLLQEGKLEAEPQLLAHLQKFLPRREEYLASMNSEDFSGLFEVSKPKEVWNNGQMSNILQSYERALNRLEAKHKKMISDGQKMIESRADVKEVTADHHAVIGSQTDRDAVMERIKFEQSTLGEKDSFKLGGDSGVPSKNITLSELKKTLHRDEISGKQLNPLERIILENEKFSVVSATKPLYKEHMTGKPLEPKEKMINENEKFSDVSSANRVHKEEMTRKPSKPEEDMIAENDNFSDVSARKPSYREQMRRNPFEEDEEFSDVSARRPSYREQMRRNPFEEDEEFSDVSARRPSYREQMRRNPFEEDEEFSDVSARKPFYKEQMRRNHFDEDEDFSDVSARKPAYREQMRRNHFDEDEDEDFSDRSARKPFKELTRRNHFDEDEDFSDRSARKPYKELTRRNPLFANKFGPAPGATPPTVPVNERLARLAGYSLEKQQQYKPNSSKNWSVVSPSEEFAESEQDTDAKSAFSDYESRGKDAFAEVNKESSNKEKSAKKGEFQKSQLESVAFSDSLEHSEKEPLVQDTANEFGNYESESAAGSFMDDTQVEKSQIESQRNLKTETVHSERSVQDSTDDFGKFETESTTVSFTNDRQQEVETPKSDPIDFEEKFKTTEEHSGISADQKLEQSESSNKLYSEVSELHQDTTQVSELHQDSAQVSDLHQDSKKTSVRHQESTQKSELHQGSTQVREFHQSSAQASERHQESTQVSELHEDSSSQAHSWPTEKEQLEKEEQSIQDTFFWPSSTQDAAAGKEQRGEHVESRVQVTDDEKKKMKSLHHDFGYPEKIKIPKNKQGSGLTFQVNDCFYDDDGEFLYRVPGMTKTSSASGDK